MNHESTFYLLRLNHKTSSENPTLFTIKENIQALVS
jgi:hypothetical protein